MSPFLRTETLDPLRVVERLEVGFRQGQLLSSDQDTREGALDLKNDLATRIVHLVRRHLRGGSRRVDASLALAPELDRLADVDRVLRVLLRLPRLELLGQEVHRRIRPQGRGRLTGPGREQRGLCAINVGFCRSASWRASSR